MVMNARWEEGWLIDGWEVALHMELYLDWINYEMAGVRFRLKDEDEDEDG